MPSAKGKFQCVPLKERKQKMTIGRKGDSTGCIPETELYWSVSLSVSPLGCGRLKGENHISFVSIFPVLVDTGAEQTLRDE